jgi:diguanylate cyclase (GGDEF)-like protein
MERHEMQEALRNDSVIDDLTQIYNRRGFVAVAGNYMKLAARTRTPFSLVFVDLDGMKPINDTLGHLEGDRALIETADLLKSCLRQSDILARLGGDEFVLLLAATDETTDEIIRRRVQERFDSCNAQPGRRYKLSFSMGIVTITAETPPPLEELLAQADAAMYREKQSKKGTATPAIDPKVT